MKKWINCNEKMPTLDLYSGVGTIGLTIGGDDVTLVEINEHAVAEMQRNITKLNRPNAKAILAPSEKSLKYITGEQIVIVDPPRAGLHADVTNRLLETEPPRIIYLSCNPVTQARDVSLLQENTKSRIIKATISSRGRRTLSTWLSLIRSKSASALTLNAEHQ